jgi:hypothetical protein
MSGMKVVVIGLHGGKVESNIGRAECNDPVKIGATNGKWAYVLIV